jgi:hypothetical protein
MPLTFVVGVAMIKDLIEDSARKKSDNEDNNTSANCAPRGTHLFRKIPNH